MAFLTTLGRPVSPAASSLGWFPVVGAGIGLALGGAWWVAGELWPPLVAAAVVVAADLAITGMLHLDGLADSADGLLAHRPDPSRRLAIMAEPGIGAYAAGVVGATLLLRTAALAAISPSPLLLAALWSIARSAMAVTARALPYARPGGLATSFLGGSAVPLALGGGALALVLAGADGVAAMAAVVAATGAGAGVVALAFRRLRGFTGDVLGAVGLVAETTGLLVAAARW